MRPRPAETRKVLTFLPHLELKWKWNCFQDNVANFILISATHFVSAQCMHSAHISGICLIGNIPNYLLSLPAPFLAIWLIQMVAKAVPGGSQSIFGGMLFSPKCCRAGLSSWVLRHLASMHPCSMHWIRSREHLHPPLPPAKGAFPFPWRKQNPPIKDQKQEIQGPGRGWTALRVSAALTVPVTPLGARRDHQPEHCGSVICNETV